MNESVPRFTVMPWLLSGLLLLVLFLVARAPASLLQRVMPAVPALQVSAWGGTVWQGQAAWSQQASSGVLSWQLKPWWLLAGRVQTDVRSQGTVPLQGVVTVGWRRLDVEQLNGQVPVSLLQLVLPPGWQLPGVVTAVNFGVSRAGWREGAWRAAEGALSWEGGTVQLPISGQPLQLTLPPLRLSPVLEGDSLRLAMTEAGSGLALAEAVVAADGQVETRVRERLLRYSPSHRSSGADPDAVVVSTRSAH
jgi:hypothetical protein